MGGTPLTGEVLIGGSKNDTLAIMAATLLVPGVTLLRNVPRNSDVLNLLEIFRHIGVHSQWRSDNCLAIDASTVKTTEAPLELVQKMRASFNILGALLTRFGTAAVAMPGGCDIGARPVNFHVRGLEQLGAVMTLEHGVYQGEVKRMTGTHIALDFPSAGATQHLMIAASLAKGRTVIENCAAEPEIVNLADFLNACGADITGAGTAFITINGVEKLKPCEFSVLPDRLQVGTYALAAAITGGDVMIRNAIYDHCRPVMMKLEEAGFLILREGNNIRVKTVLDRINPVHIRTSPHPGFPTDMQQVFAALLTLADGVSTVTETVYESRFRYTTELQKLGAEINVEGRTAIITGVKRLSGANVSCTDLRGGAALIIAGLAADGLTQVDELRHLDRGYDEMVSKLTGLGAHIERGTDRISAGGLRVCSV